MSNKKSNKKQLSLIVGAVMLLVGVVFCICSESILRKDAPIKYKALIQRYAQEYEIDELLVLSVIKTESNFDNRALSSAGAKGLMQITDETFEWLQSKTGEEYSPEALYEPEVNIRYGTYYLSLLLKQFEIRDTALAAYNAGPGRVSSWLAQPKYSKDKRTLDVIPFGETRYYVTKVNRAIRLYSELYDM